MIAPTSAAASSTSETSTSLVPSAITSMLHPVRGQHAFEACVEQLATAIRLGAIVCGSPLPPERELAERLSVSRATLREAIAALRAAGMVTTTRGRGGGTFVAQRPEVPGSGDDAGLLARGAELADALVFRRVVEPGACFVAAGQALGAHSRGLLVRALAEVGSAPDPAAHRQADSRLHLAIAHVTGSPSIIEAVAGVQAAVHQLLIAIPVLPTNIDHSTRQHQVVVEAILGGKANAARTAMEDHCDDTAALLRGLLG